MYGASEARRQIRQGNVGAKTSTASTPTAKTPTKTSTHAMPGGRAMGEAGEAAEGGEDAKRLDDGKEQREPPAKGWRNVSGTFLSLLERMRFLMREEASGPESQREARRAALTMENTETSELETFQERHWRRKAFLNKLKVVLPHVILVVGTVLYTLMGAAVFFLIERPNEEWVKGRWAEEVRAERRALLGEAWRLANDDDVQRGDWDAAVRHRLDRLLRQTFAAFQKGLKPHEIPPDSPIAYAWSYPSAIFFSTTVITTVGYGHLVPTTVLGRLFCIVYALLGIPLCLITIADIGKFVGQAIAWAADKGKLFCQRLLCRRLRCRRPADVSATDSTQLRPRRRSSKGAEEGGGEEAKQRSEDSKASELEDEELEDEEELEPEMAVAPSLILLLLLSFTTTFAAIFFASEGWTFLNSFYYCFITMVTVGFGDLVPDGPAYLPLVVVFIFSGLMLTTISIDLVGSHYITRLHYFGRNIGDWWSKMKVMQAKYGLTEEEMRAVAREVGRKGGRAFAPSEAALFSYIDNVPSTDEAASLVSCLDL